MRAVDHEVVGTACGVDLGEATANIDDAVERVIASSASTRTEPTPDGRTDRLLVRNCARRAPVHRCDINHLVAKATMVWREAFVDLLLPALARHPDRGVDVDALADHLYTTFEGAFILCRTLEDRAAMGAQLRILRQLLESLLRSGDVVRRTAPRGANARRAS
jgi:hypothetical protein